MNTPTIPDSNIVPEHTAWMGGDLTLWYEEYEAGACIARGHIDAATASRLLPDDWTLIDTPSHEWRLPTWHTPGCWDEHHQLLTTHSRAVVADMLASCDCDGRDGTWGDGPHIVWNQVSRSTPGAVPVTALYATDQMETPA